MITISDDHVTFDNPATLRGFILDKKIKMFAFRYCIAYLVCYNTHIDSKILVRAYYN